MNVRIDRYFELRNKIDLELEQTGLISDETDQLLFEAEMALTDEDIDAIEAEYWLAEQEERKIWEAKSEH